MSNYFHIVSDQTVECKSLAYSVALLHSILNDRKLYSTRGWNYANPAYTFPDIEFETSLKILKEVFNWNTNINCLQNNADEVEEYEISIRTLEYLLG